MTADPTDAPRRGGRADRSVSRRDLLRGGGALAPGLGNGARNLMDAQNDLAKIAQRVIVMRDGRIVETGPTSAVLSEPSDDYTARLLADAPRL